MLIEPSHFLLGGLVMDCSGCLFFFGESRLCSCTVVNAMAMLLSDVDADALYPKPCSKSMQVLSLVDSNAQMSRLQTLAASKPPQ